MNTGRSAYIQICSATLQKGEEKQVVQLQATGFSYDISIKDSRALKFPFLTCEESQGHTRIPLLFT